VAVTTLLTFILFESLRVLLRQIDKRFPLMEKLKTSEDSNSGTKEISHSMRIVLIPFICLVISVLLISILVSVYFRFALIINDFGTELIVFNSVYGVMAILYAIIHVSTSFLSVHKQIHYKQEKDLRKGMETDLEKFKMQINPRLLYDGLENLISIVHSQPRLAEHFVNHLSKIYRYNLDNRHVELVELQQELQLTKSLLHILNVKHNNAITFEPRLSDDWLNRQIIPCTLSSLIQELVSRSIINEYQPIHIILERNGDGLTFSCRHNPKIGLNGNSEWNLSLINKAYSFFSDNKQLEITHNNQQIHINIPLFEIEEE
jgi:sensor histidine kinase YesM